VAGLAQLHSAADFERVRRDGRSHAHPLAVLIAQANARAETRWGFAASRAVGKATARNRAKRLLREAARARNQDVAPGWDLILIARAPLAGAGLSQAQEAVDNLLKRARVLRNNG